MENNINFTGLRNIGSYTKQLACVPPCVKRTHLLVNLTDDYKGKDLTEFKNVAKRCEPAIGECSFPFDSNFIHIMTSVCNDGKDIPDLAVNYKVIPAETKTMPMFDYISKLVKRISQMADKDFVINQDFKFGPDGDEYLLPLIKISDLTRNKQERLQLLDEVYSPQSNRATAKKIFYDIQKKMYDYFDIK